VVRLGTSNFRLRSVQSVSVSSVDCVRDLGVLLDVHVDSTKSQIKQLICSRFGVVRSTCRLLRQLALVTSLVHCPVEG